MVAFTAFPQQLSFCCSSLSNFSALLILGNPIFLELAMVDDYPISLWKRSFNFLHVETIPRLIDDWIVIEFQHCSVQSCRGFFYVICFCRVNAFSRHTARNKHFMFQRLCRCFVANLDSSTGKDTREEWGASYHTKNGSVAEEQESSQRLATTSRRKVLQTGLSLCGSEAILGRIVGNRALAEDNPPITKKVFFDVSIDGQPVGRVVVGVYGTVVPVGAQRFAEIAVGQRGISYRRKEFLKVTPTYIQNAGVRTFSLSGGSADAANFTGGETNEALLAEMSELDKKGSRIKSLKGSVSLIVVDPTKPPPKPRLVARDGKFVMVEEESRPDPNGTEFTIATADSPELDASNLVVGRVLEGWDVVNQIAQVKVVQENTSSPYFQTAKLIGDTRVIVAERGFYRPYSKVLITKSGEVTE